MSTVYQKSFAAGEVSPEIYARTDLVKYATGLRTLRNFYVGKSGGAFNRPGSIYCASAQLSTYRVRLINFTLPGENYFQLEFGNGYVRILQNGQPIVKPALAITAITKATSAVVTVAEYNGFSVGDVVAFSGISGMTQMNGLTGTVTASTLTGFTVAINSSSFSTYTSGGIAAPNSVIYVQYPTIYTEAELRQLTFAQADFTLTVAHQSAMPTTIKYVAAQTWAVSVASVQPQTATPGSVAVTSSGTKTYFGITAVDGVTFEESLLSTVVGTSLGPGGGAVISWSAVAGAASYNIYIGPNANQLALLGFVNSGGTSFSDSGVLTPSYTTAPPIQQTILADAGGGVLGSMLPAAVGYYQQRLLYGNLGPINLSGSPPNFLPVYPNYGDRVYASRIGSPTYFNIPRPSTDDTMISFRMIAKKPQQIRHFLDIGKLAVFTNEGEWIVQGDLQSGGLTPSAINPTNYSNYGSGYTPPIAMDNKAMFVSYNALLNTSSVRTFGFEFQVEGYRGDDITIFSRHLVDGHQIVAWDLQKLPDQIIWAVRDDGVLLGCTFIQEQQLLAWHRHDMTNGIVEDVCNSGGTIYLAVQRTINGSVVRCIEKLASRQYSSILDAIFVDSAVTWDGRNNNPTTMTISGGTTWDYTETLTLTSSVGFFSNAMVGDGIYIRDASNNLIRFIIGAYSSSTVVTGNVDKTVLVGMRSVAFTTWTHAIVNMTGLGHLEGQVVSVIGDGFVIGSPNNAEYTTTFTVTSGAINLGTIPYGVVHVGLPITADLETLNIDNPGGQSILDKKKLITKVSMWLDASRGGFIGGVPPDPDDGDPLGDLTPRFDELKYRYSEGYDDPNRLITRVVSVNIEGHWNSNGRVFVRQVDPLPMAILAIAPEGYIPIGSP